MKIKHIANLHISILLTLFAGSFYKGNAQSSQDDIIFNAIKEEVQRGLTGLKIGNVQTPFFISYTIGDYKQMSINTSLGSLVSSEYFESRESNARLLIGDYTCSDENFHGDVSGGGHYDGSPCLDNNITGIRYTIWRDLDAIYKRAAETYEQKLASMKQLDIPAKELELPDWDTVPVVVMKNLPEADVDFNKSKYEEYLKEASSVFKDYKEICDANASLHIAKSDIYFYNTEGSEFKLPVSVFVLYLYAVTLADNGDVISLNEYRVYQEGDQLPAIEKLQEECRQLVEKLKFKKNAPALEEAYSGPVLFEGKAAAELFYLAFFEDNSLIAVRKPFSAGGYSYGGNRLEEMIDKRITAKEITITDLTGTKEYNGKKLLGYVPVDAQGVVPPKELVLVEKGFLRTLLNDRTPTHKVPHSNGHSLYNIGKIHSKVGAGVVKMTHSKQQDSQSLRQQLFEKAKEEGYDHTFIIRNSFSNIEIYKVDIETGKEELVRLAEFGNLDQQSFKKIMAVSDQEIIHETAATNLISIISPDALLFEDIEIQKTRLDNYNKPPIVPQPIDF